MIYIYTGWWFGCHLDYIFPEILGTIIIPIDEVIFFRGVAQSPTIYIYIYHKWITNFTNHISFHDEIWFYRDFSYLLAWHVAIKLGYALCYSQFSDTLIWPCGLYAQNMRWHTAGFPNRVFLLFFFGGGYSNCGENWEIQVSGNDSQWIIIGININKSGWCPTAWGPSYHGNHIRIWGPPFWEHAIWTFKNYV